MTGKGANKNDVPIRTDLPLHDMTGGNYWMPDVILYQNAQNVLRLGGGLNASQISAINAGKLRAQQQLDLAASLSVAANTVRVTNLTGHKLISGYPEGRRMWLNVKWYDESNGLVREDGKYDVVASINGSPVKSIVDLDNPNTKIYEAHYGMTQEWANQLLSLGYPASMPLGFDRVTGAVNKTLGDLAAQAPGTYANSFHFVLNNTVAKDNRIPPYGFNREEARQRNALPVPADQYGNPLEAATYNYWDDVALYPPPEAARGEISLLYQPTSWEYIQFLYLANLGQNAFLGQEGAKLLDAWLNTGMAEPYVMASADWTKPLAVMLANFDAVAQPDHVLVSWETVSELNSAGFNLYRTGSADEQPGPADLLAFVPSQAPGSTVGATYSFRDSNVVAGRTYWYWLADMDLGGATTLHDPVSVIYGAPTAVTLSVMRAGNPGAAALPLAFVLLALMAAMLLAGINTSRQTPAG
ncbi:MAG TPA: hypothetical protein VL334_10255 [Anaerolineae bacterium]|nr:hypothetical protein [Anaerolineae bacterium]